MPACRPAAVAPTVASAMLAGAREQVGQVDFALHNAGGVRCSLEPGPLSEADIAGRLLPFAIPLTLYRVHGHELAEALEGAIDNATNNGVTGNGSGSFPIPPACASVIRRTSPRGDGSPGWSGSAPPASGSRSRPMPSTGGFQRLHRLRQGGLYRTGPHPDPAQPELGITPRMPSSAGPAICPSSPLRRHWWSIRGHPPGKDLPGPLAVARQIALAGFVRKRAAFMP